MSLSGDIDLTDLTTPERRLALTDRLKTGGEQSLALLEAMLRGPVLDATGRVVLCHGECTRCALLAVTAFGAHSDTLEPLIVKHLASPLLGVRLAAVQALSQLETRLDSSVGALAEMLKRDLDTAIEAAAAVVRLGLADHPCVRRVATADRRAEAVLGRALAQDQ